MPPLGPILSIVKIFGPTLGKPAANFAADKLNQRRNARLGRTPPLNSDEAVSPEPLTRRCPPQKPVRTKIVYRPSRWQYLSSLLIGAGLTTILGLIFFRRS